MERTDLGLTIIDPGESPWEDGGSFFGRNQQVINHLLRVGALTHKHDAHAGLVNPASAPTLTSAGTGGQLGADQDVYVAFTAIDADGGETLPSPVGHIVTPAGLNVPAPPTGTPDYTAGDLPANLYYYAVTATDGAGGETAPSNPLLVTVEAGHANGRVALAGLLAAVTAVGGTGWRLYRSANGGPYGFLAAGATATFTDDCSHCADQQLPPPDDTGATAGSSAKATATVPAVALPAGTVRYRLYAAPNTSFATPALLGEWAAADAGTAHDITTFALSPGQPPAASTSVGGAAKVLASRDIDWTGYAGAPNTLALNDGVGWVDGAGRKAGHLFLREDALNESEDLRFVQGPLFNGWDAAIVDTPAGGWVVSTDYLVPATAGDTADAWAFVGNTSFADCDFRQRIDIDMQTDLWTRIGVGVSANQDRTKGGVFAVIDRAAGKLSLLAGNDPAALTELASKTVAAGFVIPPAATTATLFLTRRGNHVAAAVVGAGSITAPQHLVEADLPAGLVARWGLLPTDATVTYQSPTIIGTWPAGGGAAHPYRVDDLYSHRLYHRRTFELQIARANHDLTTEPNEAKVVVFDEQGVVLPNSRELAAVAITSFGAGWGGTGGGTPIAHKTLTGEVWFDLSLTKTTGVAPVSGDTLATLSAKDAHGNFIFAPVTTMFIPVVSGDIDGEQLGYLIVNPPNFTVHPPAAPTIVWKMGKATDPATKSPYVRLEGIRYPAAT